MNTATHLFLVRHCQSMGNLENIFQGQSDADVSAMGKKQLALLGLRFRNIRVDAVYSSPLLRARKTAEAINEYHGLPIVQLDDLKEIDVGELEGRKLTSVFEGYPELAAAWNEAPQNCVFPGGESTVQVYGRAESALRRILGESAGKTVVVTSHGFLLRNMVCALLKGDLQALPSIRISGNTSVSEFEVSETGVKAVRMNDLSHLPEELRGNPNQYVLK
ncbi:MAG: histidine phosphatase family protein [Hominenteromicrobium sp.]